MHELVFGRRSLFAICFLCHLLIYPQLILFAEGSELAITAPPVSGNLYPLYITGPQIVPASALLLSPGTTLLSSSLSYGNSFIVEELRSDGSTINLELDSEAYLLRFKAAFGITDRFELGTELQSSGQYGGFLDPIISGFHHIFGLPDGSRDFRDYNRSRFIIYQGDETLLDLSGPIDPALFVTLEAKLALIKGWNSALTLSLWTGMPLIPAPRELRRVAKTEGMAAAPRILTAVRWGALSFQLGTGLFFQGGDLSFLGELSAAWDAESPFTPVIGISGRSSPYNFGYQLSDAFSATINIGTFIEFLDLGRLQLTFTEEFFTFAAADIGFHIAWSKLFPG